MAAGGHLSENTYRWYKDGNLVATKTGDSTFTPATPGDYSVTVTNSAVNLALYSITPTNVQDSLVLVDLYNNTGGAAWTNRTNWLSSSPVSTWYGVTIENQRVTQLNISYNNLTGNLPASLATLPKVTALVFRNNQLSGPLTPTLGSLPLLTDLDLGINQFNGTIPSELANAPLLSTLNLDNNKFNGSIPVSFTHMQNLQYLGLGGNQLTGQIPGFSNLPKLTSISLGVNQLSGPLPKLTNLPQLRSLFFSNNQLTDTIPATYADLPGLFDFEVDRNQLTGSIPNFLCGSRMQILQLNNNLFTGTIPDSIGKLTSVTQMQMNNNQLGGAIPAAVGQLSFLALGSIANNKFTFAGMEYLPTLSSQIFAGYSPQANIPLIRKGDSLYVKAGGIPATETFRLYKDGVLYSTQTGDSVFKITETGKYNILSTSTTAPLLTLYSDTLDSKLILPDVTIDASQIISGTGITDVNSGIFKLVSLTPSSGANGLTGEINTLVTVDPAVSAFHGKPYVQRHYDITPDLNAANAQATVTLYFTQQDFDAYNAYVTANHLSFPLLPTNGIDNGNVRVTQYHGQFTGSSNPANYGQDTLLIAPVVSWDCANSWWSVSFPVNGFSGFFVSSGSIPLPLTLLQFTGDLNGGSVDLQWQTTNEVNTNRFIIERSNDGVAFSSIGEVAARSTAGKNQYGFKDLYPNAGKNYYRLKMVDIDNVFSYSSILSVELSLANGACLIYPNPARNSTSLLFNSVTAGRYIVRIVDGAGRILKQISGVSAVGMNKVDLSVQRWGTGVYTVIIMDEEHGRRSVRMIKE